MGTSRDVLAVALQHKLMPGYGYRNGDQRRPMLGKDFTHFLHAASFQLVHSKLIS